MDKHQRETLEACDKFAGLRNALRDVSERNGEWAGIPMPLDGQKLVIEPNFPNAIELGAMGGGADYDAEADAGGAVLRNRFFSRRLNGEVLIWQESDGRILGACVPVGRDRLRMEIQTLGCAAAWGIEQESAAVKLLGTLLTHHQFKTYLLTGMFLETSRRSGLTYLFRKLRPTVAVDARPDNGRDTTRVLAALCMHPIAYYAGTWAGAMTPTDDVVAALMLMRGDEPMFWKRSTQHAPWRPEAAL